MIVLPKELCEFEVHLLKRMDMEVGPYIHRFSFKKVL